MLRKSARVVIVFCGAHAIYQSRPYIVSQDWAAALESEWTSQQQLEQYLHLPTSVKPANDDLSEVNTQLFFIKTFARPLFELTAKGIPRKRRIGIWSSARI